MKRCIILNSEFLRKTRKSQEFTQENMAKEIGVTRCTYARYEHGRPFIDKETVYKMASLLNVDYENLVALDMNEEINKIANYPDEDFKKRLFNQE